MKKINGGYLVKAWVIPICVCITLIVLGMYLGRQNYLQYGDTPNTMDTVTTGMAMAGFAGILVSVIFIPRLLENRLTKKARRIEAGFQGRGFHSDYKFTAGNAIFYIDVDGGRLGVIWKYNPDELQFANLSGLTDVRTHDGRMFNGGTSQVRCMFRLDGKRYSIRTLLVRRGSYSMKSDEVLEAISKADTLCEMLTMAKANAMSAAAR
jgi:hypothetical protein